MQNITHQFGCQIYFEKISNCKHRFCLVNLELRTIQHTTCNSMQRVESITINGRLYTFKPTLFRFTYLLSPEEPSVLRILWEFLHIICVMLSYLLYFLKFVLLSFFRSSLVIFSLILRINMYLLVYIHTDCKSELPCIQLKQMVNFTCMSINFAEICSNPFVSHGCIHNRGFTRHIEFRHASVYTPHTQ